VGRRGAVVGGGLLLKGEWIGRVLVAEVVVCCRLEGCRGRGR